MAADTSSAAEASTDVVGALTAMFAELSVDPIRARSVAAAATMAGDVTTNDIPYLPASP
ncbi:hypothetical protein MBOU_02860 [Mycobacterium bourgelatii]|uniref:Uncharacterized protein n=1 Tax=Mycobacterium bourgelatii TaxID=1273442 RepID=A0A7I9YHW3_MYCBU|nr:hypothetical protein MBOU_02860 [Mycobacterium bourgelatii]